MSVLNLGKFRELTKDLPDDTPIMFNNYYKGNGFVAYLYENAWIFPKKGTAKAVVINRKDD